MTLHIGRITAMFCIGYTIFAQSSPPALHDGLVTVPGAKIFYRDSGGSGVPVVLLHAFTGCSQVWEHQIPAFTRAGYRFIAYDRRGFGRPRNHAA